MRSAPVVFGLAAFATACATGGPADHNQDITDANPGGGDGAHHADAPQGAAAKLLISEVALAPAGGEFVEIVNPGTQSVDLSSYYLSDNGNYFKLPTGVPTLTAGDFLVKFPAGATLAPHGVATIAIGTAAGYMTAYNAAPTYSVTDGSITVIASMYPSLTDSGEIIVLFQWDGAAPLVKDVDIILAGVPTSGNGFVSKSGYAMGAASYKSDADSMPMQASAAPSGKSTKRIALDGGHQTQNGSSNGITGDDETSEATTATWDTTATYSAPTPGQVPQALLQ